MIDTHCHLNYIKTDESVEELINEAVNANVEKIINIGTDYESSRFSVELARQYPQVYATVGVHPHDASTLNDDLLEKLDEYTSDEKVVAVGEIGLDFYRNLSKPDVQRKAFESQLKLAVDKKLPVVIHTRDAHKETVEIVRDYAFDLKGGVFHCFQGEIDEAMEVIELGFHISVGGVITFKNSQMSKTAEQAPIENVILETDAPFLTPVPYRGKTNKPAYVAFVYKKFAELKGMSLNDVIKQVDRTAGKLFGLIETFGD